MLLQGEPYAEELKRAPFDKLEKALRKLRNVDFSEIPEGQDLLELVLVGNVARHGDGPSVIRLKEFRPHPWRNEAFARPDPDFIYLEEDEVTDFLIVSPEDIQRYATAAIMFWQRVNGSYLCFEEAGGRNLIVDSPLPQHRGEADW